LCVFCFCFLSRYIYVTVSFLILPSENSLPLLPCVWMVFRRKWNTLTEKERKQEEKKCCKPILLYCLFCAVCILCKWLCWKTKQKQIKIKNFIFFMFSWLWISCSSCSSFVAQLLLLFLDFQKIFFLISWKLCTRWENYFDFLHWNLDKGKTRKDVHVCTYL
jgi:hypothetical protein